MTYCRAKQYPPKSRAFSNEFIPPLDQHGFTFVELIVVMAILGVLTSLAIPSYNDLKDKARGARAITEIREIEKVINAYAIDKNGAYPTALTDLDQKAIGDMKDPWGTPYIYVNIANAGGLPPQPYPPRLDDLGEKLNTDFDLYSMGADRDSRQSVTDILSHDDIVRSGDGGFVGIANEYFPAE
jgi:general secretion pathway protein G